jgi:hypothetical protein
MSDTHVPMIPSTAAGPLGVLHLPRLWLKVSLEARGKLAEGYPGIGKGYDQMVISGLGLDASAVRNFITENRPTYQQFESWVKAQPGVKLDRASVYQLNQSLLAFHHDDETADEILKAAGYPKDGSVCGSAMELNAVEDWQCFYDNVLR